MSRTSEAVEGLGFRASRSSPAAAPAVLVGAVARLPPLPPGLPVVPLPLVVLVPSVMQQRKRRQALRGGGARPAMLQRLLPRDIPVAVGHSPARSRAVMTIRERSPLAHTFREGSLSGVRICSVYSVSLRMPCRMLPKWPCTQSSPNIGGNVSDRTISAAEERG